MLPAVMKKAQDTQGKLFLLHHFPIRHNHYSSIFLNISITRCKLFCMEKFFKRAYRHYYRKFFLHQAKKYGRIEIPNEGIGKLYPVLLEDVWTALIAVAFGSTKKDRILFVFPKHPLANFNCSHVAKR